MGRNQPADKTVEHENEEAQYHGDLNVPDNQQQRKYNQQKSREMFFASENAVHYMGIGDAGYHEQAGYQVITGSTQMVAT